MVRREAAIAASRSGTDASGNAATASREVVVLEDESLASRAATTRSYNPPEAYSGDEAVPLLLNLHPGSSSAACTPSSRSGHGMISPGA